MPRPVIQSKNKEATQFIVFQLLILLLVVCISFPVSSILNASDLSIYYDYSQKIMQGQIPYHNFALEYPPLALLPMLLPFLLALGYPLSFTTYVWLFAILNLVYIGLILVILVSISWRWQPGRSPVPAVKALGVYAIIMILLWPWRFDLFPALLSLLMFWAVLADRPMFSGVCIGFGVAAKLYPIVFLPVLSVYYLAKGEVRAWLRMTIGCMLTISVVLLPFLLVDPKGLYTAFYYQQARGFEIESLGAGIFSMAHLLGLTKITTVLAFSAWNVDSPLANAIAKILPFFLALAMCGVLLIGWRRFREEYKVNGNIANESLLVYLWITLLAFIIFNKVLSPQFFIWLLPLGALLRRRYIFILIGVCCLTPVIFPLLYSELIKMNILAILMLNLRNGLMFILFLWLLKAYWPVSRSKAL